MGMNGIDLRLIKVSNGIEKRATLDSRYPASWSGTSIHLKGYRVAEDPPFNYTPEGFHITILDENRKRHVLQLPHSPRAIEAFSAIWNGRERPDLARNYVV